MSVADVFDALTSKRPYKEPFPNNVAKAMIVEGAGTQFDATVVDAFLICYDEILQIQSQHTDCAVASFQSSLFGEYDMSVATTN